MDSLKEILVDIEYFFCNSALSFRRLAIASSSNIFCSSALGIDKSSTLSSDHAGEVATSELKVVQNATSITFRRSTNVYLADLLGLESRKMPCRWEDVTNDDTLRFEIKSRSTVEYSVLHMIRSTATSRKSSYFA